MKSVSIIMIRKDRPNFNYYELKSLEMQRYPKELIEIIVLDDSTNQDTQQVFEDFKKVFNIRFFHFDDWKGTEHIYYNKNTGKISTAVHFNFGIHRAKGDIIIIETAETLHLGESVYDMTNIHIKYPHIAYVPGMKNISSENMEFHNWNEHPENLWRKQEIWHETFQMPGVDDQGDYVGTLCWSIRKENLLRLTGFSETAMKDSQIGWDCIDEDIYRRIYYSEMEIRYGKRFITAHLDHGAENSITKTFDAKDYRGKMRTRISKDAGFSGDVKKYPYYRPGTDRTDIQVNKHGWGTVPSEVKITEI